jgi:GWxTD domain-containing protein
MCTTYHYNKISFWALFSLILIINILSSTIVFPQQSIWDSLRTEKQYVAALDSADELTFRRDFECPFLLLLDKKQKEYYQDLKSIADRKDFIRLYWKSWNPDPLLPENEWLLVFIQRCAYVKMNFSYSESHYFDDRGKYYLKYGEPFYRYRQLGGMKTYFNYVSMRVRYYEVLGNESWIYKFPDENMTDEIVIHFVDEGTHFREIERLDDAITGLRSLKKRLWYWSDMIKERAFLMSSRHLINLTSEIESLEADLYDAQYAMEIMKNKVRRPYLRLLKYKTKNELEESIYKKDFPLATYESEKASNLLTFYDDIAQFRGPGGTTQLEVTILSPVETNLVEYVSSSPSDTLNIEYQCMLRDAVFNPLAADKMVMEFPLQIASRENLPNAIGNLGVFVPPQQGDIILQLKDMRNDKIGYAKQPLTIRDFSGQELMISDIQFLTEVKKANYEQLLPVFEKQNIIVAPYPYENIRKSIPVLCYFESYNLLSSGITSEYEIAIKVFSDKSRETAFKRLSNKITGKKDVTISLIHTRSVIDDTGKELISIDFSNLENGPYVLEITVTDVQDENNTARIQKEIRIVD